MLLKKLALEEWAILFVAGFFAGSAIKHVVPWREAVFCAAGWVSTIALTLVSSMWRRRAWESLKLTDMVCNLNHNLLLRLKGNHQASAQ